MVTGKLEKMLILAFESAAKAEIHLLETGVDAADQAKAMTRLVHVLLGCERTEKDVAIWQARADSLKARGHLHDAIGANLGTRLVACAVLLLHLDGKDLKVASAPFVRLEALLAELVARHGGVPWPVPYLEYMQFEKYRLENAPPRVDEALASTQPDTSTMAYVSSTLPPDP